MGERHEQLLEVVAPELGMLDLGAGRVECGQHGSGLLCRGQAQRQLGARVGARVGAGRRTSRRARACLGIQTSARNRRRLTPAAPENQP